LPATPWSDPPAGVTPELSGSFVELVRPVDGVAVQLPLQASRALVTLGDSGRCAAYWTLDRDHEHGRLVALDVIHSRTQSIDVGSGALGLPVWLTP
jgi:hypothetical protein